MATSPMPDDQRTTRLGSFLAGLSALITIVPPQMPVPRYPHRSEADALRGDGYRVGNDFRRVLDREREREQAPSA